MNCELLKKIVVITAFAIILVGCRSNLSFHSYVSGTPFAPDRKNPILKLNIGSVSKVQGEWGFLGTGRLNGTSEAGLVIRWQDPDNRIYTTILPYSKVEEQVDDSLQGPYVTFYTYPVIMDFGDNGRIQNPNDVITGNVSGLKFSLAVIKAPESILKAERPKIE